MRIKNPLIKSFDDQRKCLWCKLSATAPCIALPPASMQSRTNSLWLIPFVVSLSNHKLNQLIRSFLNFSAAMQGSVAS